MRATSWPHNTADGDLSDTNEIQTLSLSGNDLSISGTGGNTVSLTAFLGSNLATDNLVQETETRTYDMNSQNLGFTNGKLGVGTNTPTSTLHTSGSFATAIRRTTVSTTFTDNDFTLITDNSVIETTITFPAANTCTGRIYIVRNIGGKDNLTNITYIKANGDVEDSYKIPNDKTSWFQSDGTDWHLINNF